MCETAELLRFGATMLVLDAAESGAFQDVPRLHHPIAALRAICADPTLSVAVAVRNRDSMSALQIQNYYLEQCTRFLNEHPAVPAEAWEILRLWSSTLQSLQGLAGQEEPDCSAKGSLLGSIDWVTKKYLLDNAAADATWTERKKVDICYHELSEDGYYQVLSDARLVTNWTSEADIERAIRTPPANSPATTRGQYIREFACSGTPVIANWKVVVLGNSWDSRVIRIADYGRPADPSAQDAKRETTAKP